MTDPRHNLEALGALNATETPPTPPRGTPAGSGAWQPGYTLDGDSGELTTSGELGDGTPDWDHIFAQWNLDPNEWKVVDGTLRVNAWEGPSQEGPRIFRQYKAQLCRRVAAHGVPIDPTLERLCSDWPEPTDVANGSGAFVVCAADWQVGGHGGAEAFVDRFHESLAAVEARARWAVEEGLADSLVWCALGDQIEGVSGQYESQRFEVCLDLREQIRLVRHAEAKMLATLSPLFASTTAVAVPGNHGRRTRKVETTFEDNSDLEAFEVVAELMHASGEAERHNISFVLPHETLIALVDAAGTRILFAHGDQAKNPNGLEDIWRKWSYQKWGDADAAHVCAVGHFHHLRVEEVAKDRTLMVCPTLGGDSRWFHELGGGTSNPGTLTFVAGDGRWDHLKVC